MKVIKALLIAECEPRSLFGGLASQPHLGDDCICAHDAEQQKELLILSLTTPGKWLALTC